MSDPRPTDLTQLPPARETWLNVDNLSERQRVGLFRLFDVVATQCNGHERVYVADVELLPKSLQGREPL